MKRTRIFLSALVVMALIVSSVGAQSVSPQSSPLVLADDATPAATPAEVPGTGDIDRAISFYPEETGEGTYITVELDPGESAEVIVILGNSGEIEQNLRTYAVPALSGTNGGFVLSDYGTETDETTSWLDYPEQQYELIPTEGVRISVPIHVPADTQPGEYMTGLAGEAAEAFEVPGSEVFRQRTRWAIPVFIVVPGDREPAFEVFNAKLEWFEGSLYGLIEIANTGNVTVRPTGEVRLIDSYGVVVGVANVELGAVYTGTETTFLVGWEDPPLSDQYDVEVVLSTEEGSVTVEQKLPDVDPINAGSTDAGSGSSLIVSSAELAPATTDSSPSLLLFNGEISNTGEPVEDARVSIVTYQDGVEVDRYPIMQAVTIEQGTVPIEARYSLPGGFTDGTYTFEVTIEVGDVGTQTILVTQPIDYEVVVGD